MIKIKLIIPCFGSLEYASQKCFKESLDRLKEADTGDYNIQIIPKIDPYISMARNTGVSNSILKHQTITDCDYCLFIDADTGFTFGNIVSLIAANKSVIGGAVPYRKGHLNEAFYCAGNFYDGLPGFICSLVNRKQTGIVKVDWTGGNFVLVRADVFSKIEYPWFHFGVLDNGDSALEYGEDIGFCIKCYKANIPIYLHCDLEPKLIHEKDIKIESKAVV